MELAPEQINGASSEDFAGRIVIVTGGAQGIGFAIAEAFVQRNARIALLDLNPESACAAVDRLGGPQCAMSVETNIGDPESVSRAVEAVFQKWGRIDVLVNNAGVQFNCASLELRPEDLQQVLNTNLLGAFYASQAVARTAMVAQEGGVIINISSVASFMSFPRRMPYGISKAGLNALTRILATEWAGYKIRINAIAPGYVRTQLVEDAARWGHIDLPAVIGKTPAERLGHPSEIAELAVFLASHRAAFLTGQVVTIDGGFSLTK
ncbi:MAG TPA: SDR family oxidoreductase [Bryobacteraceae bacterium]|nr:SDR family oxidoreductase [Bryobacteraceae bacterium]